MGLRGPIAGLCCAVMLLGLGTGSHAATPPLLFGAKVTPSSAAGFQALESTVGRPLSLTRLFYVWDSKYPDAMTTWVQGRTDITPILSVKTKTKAGAFIPWSSIANAQPGDPAYNTVVTWAQRMKAWNRTVYFSFNHEASNTKSLKNGTSTEYVAAWKRVWQIFRDNAVTNVRWTWILGDTPYQVPSTDRRFAAKWYPGDDYVDVLAIDQYNWATCNGSPWASFAEDTVGFVAFAAAHPTEDTMVAEWGTVEDATLPDRKAQWITEAGEAMKTWPNLVGAAYFDSNVDCNWSVSSSPSSLEAFTRLAQDPWFGGTATVEEPPAG